MVKYRNCSVRGCKDKISSRHSFPNPIENPQRFNKWLNACANKDLLGMHPQKVFRLRKVCDSRFFPSAKKIFEAFNR